MLIGTFQKKLYLIEILHQTTTYAENANEWGGLYLIEILHQTTTERERGLQADGCILLKFYIKPQQYDNFIGF